ANPNSCHIGTYIKPFYSNIEEDLIKWIEILRQDGIAVSLLMNQQKMKLLVNKNSSNNKKLFIASWGKKLPTNLPSNVVVKMQEKDWINEDLMKVEFQEIWEKH
ncbi:1414_t:CDS:2, partial [Funneliformis geosporum]